MAAETEKAELLAVVPPRKNNVTRLVTDGAAKCAEMVKELGDWLRKNPQKAQHILLALFQAGYGHAHPQDDPGRQSPATLRFL